jgi:competence protein ComEA
LKFKIIAGILLLTITAFIYLQENRDFYSDKFLISEGGVIKEGSFSTEQIGDDSQSEANDHGAERVDQALEIIVDVDGSVQKPGIVKLPQNSRIYEAIDAAGGLRSTADTSSVNLAAVMTDGEKIYIPDKSEAAAIPALKAKSLININTADSLTLQKISGRGPSTAEKIIEHRTQYGKFRKIEDIKNVSGIGDKTFEKFKTQICVN